MLLEEWKWLRYVREISPSSCCISMGFADAEWATARDSLKVLYKNIILKSKLKLNRGLG
jgi:hypothetical protein